MATVAIVPLRSLHDGKRRLSGELSSAERAALVQRLFLRAQRAIMAAAGVEQLCVVSPDPALLEWVAGEGALPLLQPDHGLNAGLEYARQTLLERRAWSSLLVVLPDLPLIDTADVGALLRLGERGTVVVASDRHGAGTNALLLQPPDSLPFSFGAHSLQRHTAAARSRGLVVREYAAPSMALDLDTADDLRMFEELAVAHSMAIRRGP
ncbi:MAG TPA: 2-phospho-L-lactate guanylyltransferase [Herpetosiphonaceae bacterium]